MAVLYLDPFTAMYCCHAVVSEDAKTTLASGLQTSSLERESNTVSRCVRPCIKLTPDYPFKNSGNFFQNYPFLRMASKWSRK